MKNKIICALCILFMFLSSNTTLAQPSKTSKTVRRITITRKIYVNPKGDYNKWITKR